MALRESMQRAGKRIATNATRLSCCVTTSPYQLSMDVALSYVEHWRARGERVDAAESGADKGKTLPRLLWSVHHRYQVGGHTTVKYQRLSITGNRNHWEWRRYSRPSRCCGRQRLGFPGSSSLVKRLRMGFYDRSDPPRTLHFSGHFEAKVHLHRRQAWSMGSTLGRHRLFHP